MKNIWFPEYGGGEGAFALPLCRLEHGYNVFAKLLMLVALAAIGLLPLPVAADILARQFLGFTFYGVTEMETLAMVFIVFSAMPYIAATRSNIVVDLFFGKFSQRTQRRLHFFLYLAGALILLLMAAVSLRAGLDATSYTQALFLPDSFFLYYCAMGMGAAGIGMLFQVARSFLDLARDRDWTGIGLAPLLIVLLALLPFLYKGLPSRPSSLAMGAVGFALLFVLLFLRMPIGLGMCSVAVLGLLCIMRTPAAAWSLVGEVPYREVANFVMVAVPMFMLMGELTSVSSISRDMFDCANKWLGRAPGGLACATVGGCAGFGAICGDSMTTVITMSAVALPHMRRNGYAPGLATGSLAAGGTLGILIPPSMGFIYYSLMTEESVGTLFIAGIVPGLLLAAIFIAIIIVRVRRDPSLAPPSARFSRAEKLRSLVGLAPMLLIFAIVVGGMMSGYFTPGEGGAVGALCAFLYALARRRMSLAGLRAALFNTALMTGKVFVIMVGVYVFSAFLAASRMPALLAAFVAGLEVSRYAVLAIVILLYILLGCVMNIVPMMLLTLPSIYPSIQALGIDGIWFGVITVIVQEMGLITPPIGLNVFTMASLAPDIGMGVIFRGVMPFFLGMVLCTLLIILFPQLALWLPGVL